MNETLHQPPLPETVVAIGGGTGTSTMVRGLRSQFSDVVAIVGVGDDGGSTEFIRREFHDFYGTVVGASSFPAPGDARKCLSALIPNDALAAQMEACLGPDATLADIRRIGHEILGFSSDIVEPMAYVARRLGKLEGHKVGNIAVAGLTVASDIQTALDTLGEQFAVNGRVVAGSLRGYGLRLRLANGDVIDGQHRIDLRPPADPFSARLELTPGTVLNPAVDQELSNGRIAVVGPGSAITSVGQMLSVPGMADRLRSLDPKSLKLILNFAYPKDDPHAWSGKGSISFVEDKLLMGLRFGTIFFNTAVNEIPANTRPITLSLEDIHELGGEKRFVGQPLVIDAEHGPASTTV